MTIVGRINARMTVQSKYLEVIIERRDDVTLTKHILKMKETAIAPNKFRRLGNPDRRSNAKPGSRKTSIAMGTPMKFMLGNHFRLNWS